jgi:hypothetical protein
MVCLTLWLWLRSLPSRSFGLADSSGSRGYPLHIHHPIEGCLERIRGRRPPQLSSLTDCSIPSMRLLNVVSPRSITLLTFLISATNSPSDGCVAACAADDLP